MTLDLVVDIVLVLIVVIGFIVGLVRGFIKSVSHPIKVFGSLALAIWLAQPISDKLVFPLFGGTLANRIEGYLLANCSNPEEELPTLVKLAAGAVGVDLEGKTLSVIITELTNPVVGLISVILTFVALYFAARLLLALVFYILDRAIDSSVLVIPNKIAGCILNTLMGAIIAWCAVFVFNFVINLPAFEGQAWVNEFVGGPIYSFFSRISPVELLLSF